MLETRIARLFKNGSSQAVRLPAEFRFESEEIYITRDAASGDVVLSTRPGAKAWDEFFALIHSIEASDDFMAERPLNVIPHERDLFAEDAG
ncbi:MAG: AbrB/MazE/SpoVT family DNA-binding domain-containing protein [Candidatus Competibacter sp.]|nr:AbrB/MazE/SpoVT family DNA-binding domain-containing protein [Candidatus Competibacter sp.]MDG4605554.1 AbrB/MazE/SpoVT family DNA-binding domain-containing protein [Candidatus Contendobacter sp.]HRD48726.1 AbrB/MazE/SpoVT family DNA-binding domain-containing protein [Candidatus Contendobacter sp.]